MGLLFLPYSAQEEELVSNHVDVNSARVTGQRLAYQSISDMSYCVNSRNNLLAAGGRQLTCGCQQVVGTQR